MVSGMLIFEVCFYSCVLILFLLQIPHEFYFHMYMGRCIMQYKHFASDPNYLPEIPNDLSEPYDGASRVIRVEYFQSIGGVESYASLVRGGTVAFEGRVFYNYKMVNISYFLILI